MPEKRLGAFADKHKLMVGYHGHAETGPKEWKEVFSYARHNGANLDIGHSQVLGEDIPDSVKLLGDRIWNLHVEDIPGRKHYHLIPGEGTLDWSGLRNALVAIKYERYLTVELYTHTANPVEAAQKSFAFLSKHFPA